MLIFRFRMARGEDFNVMAKRLNSNGDVQHLMAWEQPITKPFLANLVENNDEIEDVIKMNRVNYTHDYHRIRIFTLC